MFGLDNSVLWIVAVIWLVLVVDLLRKKRKKKRLKKMCIKCRSLTSKIKSDMFQMILLLENNIGNRDALIVFKNTSNKFEKVVKDFNYCFSDTSLNETEREKRCQVYLEKFLSLSSQGDLILKELKLLEK